MERPYRWHMPCSLGGRNRGAKVIAFLGKDENGEAVHCTVCRWRMLCSLGGKAVAILGKDQCRVVLVIGFFVPVIGVGNSRSSDHFPGQG
jgi:hypothetical protein